MRARRGGLGGQVLGKPLEVPARHGAGRGLDTVREFLEGQAPLRGGIADAGHYALALGVRGADGRSPGVSGQ
jgi:hypothetical protein